MQRPQMPRCGSLRALGAKVFREVASGAKTFARR